MQYLRLYPESVEDVNKLQKILIAAPSYFIQLKGKHPGPDAAMEVLRKLPPGKTNNDKYVFAIQYDNEFIGCIDLVRDYPDSKTAFIGLLLFIESEQNKFHGPKALKQINSLAIQWGCIKLRIAVIDKNQRALAFWKREGFIELYRKHSEQFSSNAIIMECDLICGHTSELGQKS